MISGRPMRRRSFARPTTAMNLSSCAGAFRRPRPKGRRLLISVPRNGAFQSAYVGASVSLLRVYGKKVAEDQCKFTKAGEDWFCFAGLWRPMPGGGDAFTLLATKPGPDVEPIHDRQMVILNRDDWTSWLDLTRPEGELLKPLAAGSRTVEQVRS
jgi:SOS response associated peptidase (SRAP)